MTKHDHNKQDGSGHLPGAPIATLGDLYSYIDQQDLPTSSKATIKSAIKRADVLVGHGLLDLPADPEKIIAALETWSPAMAGMTAQAFANLKSRVRTAFRLAKPLMKPRQVIKLDHDWSDLRDQLQLGDQRRLSRFLHFACGHGWKPGEISDTHLERFEIDLRDEAMIADWSGVTRNTIKAWNRIAKAEGSPGLPLLTPPPCKRTPYWVEFASMPHDLRSEIEAFMHHIGQPKTFVDISGGGLKEGTVEQYRHGIVTLVSALAASGDDLASMETLSRVVAPARVERALRFLYARAGNRVTSRMLILASRARRVAQWCKLPTSALDELDRLVEKVKAASPRSRGMTEKNRRLLDRLDDARFRDLVYVLPHMLWRRAYSAKREDEAISYARSAIAIELLLTCSMRRANLVELELGENIRKVGQGRDATWIVEYEAEDVKNEEPLRYTLPPESADLLECYLRDWRPRMSSVLTPWLFPRTNGEPIDGKTMANDIRKKARLILGVPVTPHQFRHIATELYLRDHPEQLDLMSQHLGHKDPNTTRMYYARSKQGEASRRYQQRLHLDRSEAVNRIGRGKRIRRNFATLPEEDLL